MLVLCVYTCMCVCGSVHRNTGTVGGQKRASDPLELKLWAVVSCPALVLGTELRSSAKAVCALGGWALFPALFLIVRISITSLLKKLARLIEIQCFMLDYSCDIWKKLVNVFSNTKLKSGLGANIRKAEAGRWGLFMCSRPAWPTQWVPSQSGPHSKTSPKL